MNLPTSNVAPYQKTNILKFEIIFLNSPILLKYWDDSVIQEMFYEQHEKGLIVVRDMISTLHRWTLSAGAVVKRPLDLK
jgi:hypothetical protein